MPHPSNYAIKYVGTPSVCEAAALLASENGRLIMPKKKGEQMDYFDRHGMHYHITPGISSFQAAAAALKSQFTIPERVQSIILTRGEGRTPMPEREKLHLLARSQSTICIFLSAGIVEEVAAELLQEYPDSTPVAVCHHLTWPDERVYRGTLKELVSLVKDNGFTLTTLIVVGEAIGNRKGLSQL